MAVFPKGGFGSLTSDFEILRGDLARVLSDSTRSTCKYRFGTSVSGIEEMEDGVRATLVDASTEVFELGVSADGLSSSTTGLALAQETRLRYLGARMAIFNIPRRPEDDLWGLLRQRHGRNDDPPPAGRPDGDHRPDHLPGPEPDAQKPSMRSGRDMLRAALQGRGTVADRIIDELDAVQDFYLGLMSQVQASTWSKGRLVLLGDAAHCPTPFTGEGTVLALVGAYIPDGGDQEALDFYRRFARIRKHPAPLHRVLTAGAEPSAHSARAREDAVRDAVARVAQRFFGSAPIQALLKPSAATRARKIDEDFAIPVC